jgi:hypothetical protein
MTQPLGLPVLNQRSSNPGPHVDVANENKPSRSLLSHYKGRGIRQVASCKWPTNCRACCPMKNTPVSMVYLIVSLISTMATVTVLSVLLALMLA